MNANDISPAVIGAPTVLLVDDHTVARLGLRAALERGGAFRVVAEADTPAAALDALAAHPPDLVVADVDLGGHSGLDLVRRIRTHEGGGGRAAPSVLVVSMHDPGLYARRALAAGAGGYVTKHSSAEEILRAARAVVAGATYVTGGLNGLPPALDPDARPAAPRRSAGDLGPDVSSLTDRELEVFLLLGRGYAPRHIADELHLSVSTVEVYRERLKQKLGVADSALLVRYAVRWLHDHERGTPAA